MDQHKIILIKQALDKAQEALRNAQVDFEQNLFSGAQNRIYYAVFYTVMSLGYVEGFITGSHKQLQGWFNRKFIYENKVFDETTYQIYKTIYDNRMKYDYDVSKTPDKETIIKDLEDAEYFVKTVSDYIKSRV